MLFSTHPLKFEFGATAMLDRFSTASGFRLLSIGLSSRRRIDLAVWEFDELWGRAIRHGSAVPSWPKFADQHRLRFSAVGEFEEFVFELIAVDVERRRTRAEVVTIENYTNDDHAWFTPELASRIAASWESFASTVADSADSVDAIPDSIGDYHILRELARGGMGVVLKARHRKLNRLTAIKLILTGRFADREELRRFQTEAFAASQLDHPNIVPLYEVGEFQNRPYLAFAYVEGGSLWSRIKEQPLEPVEAAKMLAALALAIDRAHQKGIIHRDIKPQNILIETDGTPRITDFGLAKYIHGDSGLTVSGKTLGTPSYMPPEQAMGNAHRVGPQSDVYSLGATLYAAITGRPPFQSASSIETMKQVTDSEVITPRELNRAIPRDLETICLKTLEKNPTQRYATAREFADDLSRFVRKEPILARPVGSLERVWRWSQRNPIVAGLGAVAVGLTLLVMGIGLIALSRERDHSQTTEKLLADVRRELARSRFNQAIANSDTGRITESQSGFVQAWSQLHRDDPFELSYRQFAWNALTHDGTLATVPMWHDQDVTAARFSRDGNTVITGCRDGSVWFWDTVEGVPLATDRSLGGEITHLALDRLGTRVAVASSNGQIQLFDIPTRTAVFNATSHGAAVTCVEWFPNGRRFASAGIDGRVRIWDAATGAASDTAFVHEKAVKEITIDGQGRRLLAIGESHFASLWTFDNAETVEVRLPHDDAVYAATFSPTGSLVATAGWDGKAQLWDLEGNPVAKPIEHDDIVVAVGFDPRGENLLTASRDSSVRVWNLKRGEPSATYRNTTQSIAARFGLEGKSVLTASDDGIVRVLDATKLQEIAEPMRHPDTVVEALFSDDGTQVLTICQDRAVRVWNPIVQGQRASRLPVGVEATSVAQCSDTEPVASHVPAFACGQSLIHWDTLEKRHFVEPIGYSHILNVVAVTSLGDRTAVGCSDNTISVFDVKSRVQVVGPMTHKMRVACLSYDRSGDRIVSGSEDRTARIWDANSGQMVVPELKHEHNVIAAKFTNDGKRVVTGTVNNAAYLWDAATGRQLAKLPHLGVVSQIELSHDGSTIATGGEELSVSLWDARDGRLLGKTSMHEQRVVCFAFDPARSVLVTGSEDATFRLWDARTSQPMGDAVKCSAPVRFVQFDATGRRLLTACENGVVAIWDPTTGRMLGHPFSHGRKPKYAQFNPTAEFVLMVDDIGNPYWWDVATEPPPATVAQDVFAAWSGVKSDNHGRIVSLKGEVRRALWRGIDPVWKQRSAAITQRRRKPLVAEE